MIQIKPHMASNLACILIDSDYLPVDQSNSSVAQFNLPGHSAIAKNGLRTGFLYKPIELAYNGITFYEP